MVTFTVLLRQSSVYHIVVLGRIACYLFSIPGSRDGIPPLAAKLASLITKSGCLAEGIQWFHS